VNPIVVTAYLGGPVLGPTPHLDALLAHAFYLRHQSTTPSRRTGRGGVRDPRIPLARLQGPGGQVYLCTVAEPVGPSSPAVVHQTRRRDAVDWAHLAKPVTVTSGPQKDVLIRRRGAVHRAVRWYAWGQRAEVRKALKLIWGKEGSPMGHLGSARRSGAGQITRWQIEVGSHTPERCIVRDGQAARHVPLAWSVDGSNPWRGAIQSPYWMPAHQTEIVRLGTPLQLTPAIAQALTLVPGC
jgi:hypothetical protein